MTMLHNEIAQAEVIESRKAICDTVRLQIKFGDFEIIEDKFEPPAEKVIKFYGRGKMVSYQYMSMTDKKMHHYKPRLALKNEARNGGRKVFLYIDLSLPKLLYGNNLQEVCDQDFKPLIKKLCREMLEMGVLVKPNVLAHAHVCAFHSCKNIVLPKNISTQYVIEKIGKISLGARLGTGHTDYLNGGHCARFHTNTYEIAVYDKIADIKQAHISPKRCVDHKSHRDFQDINIEELNDLQVFRIEIRLNNAKILRNKLAEAGISFESGHEITFCDIFKSEVSSKLNILFWQKIQEEGKQVYLLEDSSENMLLHLGNIKLLKKFEFIGMAKVINDCGAPYVRRLMGKNVTALKLFNLIKNYEPDDKILMKIFEGIGKKIAKNDVIILPDKQI